MICDDTARLNTLLALKQNAKQHDYLLSIQQPERAAIVERRVMRLAVRLAEMMAEVHGEM